MPADDGSPLGSPAWPLVPRPKFMVGGAAGLPDELRYRHQWLGHLSVGLLAYRGEG